MIATLAAAGVPLAAADAPGRQHGEGQPRGALSGAVITLSPGHGWYVSGGRWVSQRGPSHGVVEDISNGELVIQYLLPYLWNAGATVYTTRERDMQTNSVTMTIPDDIGHFPADNGSVALEGPWIFEDANGTRTGRHAIAPTGRTHARATFAPAIPETGQYAVYVWYRQPLDGRASEEATFTIRHSGGATKWVQNQEGDARTWRYLGTYHFEAGHDASRASLVLENTGGRNRHVSIEAVRFGGGMGDFEFDGAPSGYPRWEESGLYYTQELGFRPEAGDVRRYNQVHAMPRWAEWNAEPWQKGRSIFISWHTNGSVDGQARGLSSYIYGPWGWGPWDENTALRGTVPLAHSVHGSLLRGMRSGWDADWEDIGIISRWLGETNPQSNGRMPALLLENGFHDNPIDAAAILEPEFRRIGARSTYHGILDYFVSHVSGFNDATRLPEPPRNFSVRFAGRDTVQATWSQGLTRTDAEHLGDPANAWRVYRSRNGYGFDNGAIIDGPEPGTRLEVYADATNPGWALRETIGTMITDVQPGRVHFVRVAGANSGGESLPTEALPILLPQPGERPRVLLVNGFTRLDRGLNFTDTTTFPGRTFERGVIANMNPFTSTIAHAESLASAGLAFDSATRGAIESGAVRLIDYDFVVWIAGRQGGNAPVFTPREQARVEQFLDTGRRMLLTGAHLVEGLTATGDGARFMAERLGIESATNIPPGMGIRLRGQDVAHTIDAAPYHLPHTEGWRMQDRVIPFLEYREGLGAGVRRGGLTALAFPLEAVGDPVERRNYVIWAMRGE